MSSRKPVPSPAPSLAMALLARLGTCREQLKEAAEQLRQSRDDKDASRMQGRHLLDSQGRMPGGFLSDNCSRRPPFAGSRARRGQSLCWQVRRFHPHPTHDRIDSPRARPGWCESDRT